MSKRSYGYNGYYIEVAVQEVGEKHFEGMATIFGSRETARRGQGPVHRCARMGRTREEADRAVAASAESWADGPGPREPPRKSDAATSQEKSQRAVERGICRIDPSP